MRHPAIVEARLEAGRWSAAKPVSFSGAHPDSSPALSPDGKRLFFASQRPLPGEDRPSERWHIWFVESAPGGWGSPQPVGPPVLDKEKNQVSPSVTAKGTLYYAQEGKGWDIYRARFVDGKYAAPEPVRVNSPNNEEWVAVAPDESFLVYSSAGGAESAGEGDLYLDRDLNAPPKWEESKSLDSVNTAHDESNPRLSPDGKTLFFARDGDVYEVELEAPDRPDPRWSARAPMLDPRVWPQAIVAGGKIYVYGGLTKMPAVNKTFEEYDPVADRWRKRADPPSNWANGALAAVKGRIYLLRRDAAGMAQYDPAGDTWSVRGEDAAGPVIHEGPPYTLRAVTVGDRVFTVKTCGAGGPVTVFVLRRVQHRADAMGGTGNNALSGSPTCRVQRQNLRSGRRQTGQQGAGVRSRDGQVEPQGGTAHRTLGDRARRMERQDLCDRGTQNHQRRTLRRGRRVRSGKGPMGRAPRIPDARLGSGSGRRRQPAVPDWRGGFSRYPGPAGIRIRRW